MAGLSPFSLEAPLPRYRASESLKRALVEFLIREQAPAGAKFHTAQELTRITGRSYGMVRRTVDQMLREGWLTSRPGNGLFVGPRVETPAMRVTRRGAARETVRLAVMSRAGLSVRFWFLHEMLEGMESAAAEHGVAVELMSRTSGSLETARRRLALIPPDVLVDVIPDEDGIRMIGEAERMGVRCIAAGLRAPGLQIPNVHEDSADGAAQAVKHLQGLGHRRIGFVMNFGMADWYMADRRQGYLDTMAQAGVTDRNLIHENPWDARDAQESARAFDAFRRRMRISAAIFSASWTLDPLLRLVKAGTLSVPRDLSLVVFDQAPEIHDRLGLRVTHVAQPLFEEGREVVKLARLLADGKPVPKAVYLPCRLVEGDSVARIGRRNVGA